MTSFRYVREDGVSRLSAKAVKCKPSLFQSRRELNILQVITPSFLSGNSVVNVSVSIIRLRLLSEALLKDSHIWIRQLKKTLPFNFLVESSTVWRSPKFLDWSDT